MRMLLVVAVLIASSAFAADVQGERVVAIVESLDRNGSTEHLVSDDGLELHVSTVVRFRVLEPKSIGVDLLVGTQGQYHPRFGTRPLLLGDIVEFTLPPRWRNQGLQVVDLIDPKFRE